MPKTANPLAGHVERLLTGPSQDVEASAEEIAADPELAGRVIRALSGALGGVILANAMRTGGEPREWVQMVVDGVAQSDI